MTTLLLVRHAIAEERGEAWPDDDLRPLTGKGIGRMRDVAAGLQAMGETADVVLTSPLTRASETASILLEAWSPRPKVTVVEALAPGNAPADTMAALAVYSKTARVALVGHEPDLGVLAAWLIGSKRPLPFKKGGVARIDIDLPARARSGQLIWLATPRMLRKID